MKISETEIAGFLEILEQSPRRIRSASKGSPPARLYARPAKKPWSANAVLAHLRSCADMWGGSIIAMLTEENPTLPDVHPRKWIKQTDYPEMDFRKSFEAYLSQREELLPNVEETLVRRLATRRHDRRQETHGLLAGTPYGET